MNRVWKCLACRREFDMAIIAPKYPNLSDAELVAGAWHLCCGEPVQEPEDSPAKLVRTRYDWKTGKPR